MATKPAKGYEPDEEFNTMSAEWMELTARMAVDKAREIELRNALIKKLYPRGIIPVGTNNHSVGEGWVVKVAGKVNSKVDETMIASTRELMVNLAKEGKVQPFDLDEVIRFKPELSASGWNALTTEQQHVVKNCVTFTPGQAGLEIVKPKRAVK